jgi:hypothetical protein
MVKAALQIRVPQKPDSRNFYYDELVAHVWTFIQIKRRNLNSFQEIGHVGEYNALSVFQSLILGGNRSRIKPLN